ncbi:hypothetical protein [Pseudomonas citronellolis]|uniref:hypothetical protein n=1 Tax=Pseudomonas citronellolis TaxID=53408 RepID=UPI0021BF1DDA|nr:hypothetical protein [Pseudomonas citronellolis]UXJ53508.1 hypothetical protein N5P21_04595 [Pseudomonas citronellolis]
MQGIYEDGVGDVDKYINENLILKIKKPDNFRCSEQVIKFINRFRTDDLQQELALKKKNGSFEKNEDRQGAIRLYYLMNDNKPNLQSPTEEKLAYTNSIHTLIDAAKNDMNGSFRILMLTNKAIAEKAGFGGLYEIFAKRFGRNLKDQLEKTLTTLQFNEIFDLIKNDENSQHWMIIENAKKSGYRFENAKSKSIILSAISALKKQTLAANKAISKLISLKIISESNSRKSFISRCQLFLEELEENQEFQRFKQLYNSGFNTYAKFSKEDSSIDEYEFYDFERDHNKENFFQSLLSDKLELSEIISYFRYINEESEYITMHKTKGTGIKNTIVVFDEFFWPSYKFKDIFIESNLQYISDASKKILYVACSRTISNLFCVRIISSSEKADLDKFFETAIEVNT